MRIYSWIAKIYCAMRCFGNIKTIKIMGRRMQYDAGLGQIFAVVYAKSHRSGQLNFPRRTLGIRR
jgi:hypothetical protein